MRIRASARSPERAGQLSRLTLGACAAIVVIGVAGAAFIASGVYDIAAATPHWPATTWLIEQVRNRSVKARASAIDIPPRLNDPAKIVMGTEHFAAHCASCHGAPGVPRGEIAEGLYPKPADLARAPAHYTPAELFWIVRNGIKMTGMPAWSDHSDEELWATVAFVEKLPGMTQGEYGKLVMQSMKMGGRHQHDAMAAPGTDMKNMPMPDTGDNHQQ